MRLACLLMRSFSTTEESRSLEDRINESAGWNWCSVAKSARTREREYQPHTNDGISTGICCVGWQSERIKGAPFSRAISLLIGGGSMAGEKRKIRALLGSLCSVLPIEETNPRLPFRRARQIIRVKGGTTRAPIEFQWQNDFKRKGGEREEVFSLSESAAAISPVNQQIGACRLNASGLGDGFAGDDNDNDDDDDDDDAAAALAMAAVGDGGGGFEGFDSSARQSSKNRKNFI
ncbi:hypothetical protein K0M31_009186 [Melipona bicolor]|uniref:Uncharacterized protein n=1 Tax=Melipona bicolor TaxID=60889 RepID=A0AA40FPW4_9HYME|nr:hypothetical protein K0M31_009186 [Melipona bicolor]